MEASARSSFFCQDVLAALARELPLIVYEDGPGTPEPPHLEADETDVVLVVNFYGMRVGGRAVTKGVILEDHTHDPLSTWAATSHADYAVASLRKTLPLPDGGGLWSPKGRDLPREAPAKPPAHLLATADRLTGMTLKLQYLSGGLVDKADFRTALVAGERAIGEGEVSGISAFSRARLRSLPSRRWRSARAANLTVFRREVAALSSVRLLDAPFAAMLQFDSSDLCDLTRTALIARRVYPAVPVGARRRSAARHPPPARRAVATPARGSLRLPLSRRRHEARGGPGPHRRSAGSRGRRVIQTGFRYRGKKPVWSPGSD